MARLEKTLNGNFDTILERIERTVLDGGATESYEHSCDLQSGGARCSVRVFERYSCTGRNRQSMSVNLFQGPGENEVHLFAVTEGGSQAMFFEMRTPGEDALLTKLRAAL